MRMSIGHRALVLSAFTGFALHAALVEIPYSGSKTAGTVVVEVAGSGRMNPDTLRIGAATVRFYLASTFLPAVCGAKTRIVAQFLAPFGTVSQRTDTATDWNALTSYPSSGLMPVDSVAAWENWTAMTAEKAPGFSLYAAGQRNDCTGAEYFLSPYWNRVVFLRFGSGVDYRARLSFQAKRDTLYGPTPLYQFEELKSLTLHYVLNANSSDLSGAPVALRSRPASGIPSPSPGLTFGAFYNLLGVRLKREPRSPEVVIPLRRSR